MAIEQNKAFFGNVGNEYRNTDERSHDSPTSWPHLSVASIEVTLGQWEKGFCLWPPSFYQAENTCFHFFFCKHSTLRIAGSKRPNNWFPIRTPPLPLCLLNPTKSERLSLPPSSPSVPFLLYRPLIYHSKSLLCFFLLITNFFWKRTAFFNMKLASLSLFIIFSRPTLMLQEKRLPPPPMKYNMGSNGKC